MIIPLSSAIRGSQHPHIEDPNYLRTQNVPGLHTLGSQFFMYEKHTTSSCTITPILHVRKTYHIYMQNYPNSSCTKNTPGLHAELPQFCMYAKHIWPTVRFRFRFRLYRGGFWTTLYEKHTTSTCTRTPILHVHRSLFSYTRQFCMYTSGAGNSVSVSIVRKIRATTRGRSRASTEAGGASQRRLLSTQFFHEGGSGLVSTALDKSVLRLLVQCGGLFFSGPGPYLGLNLVIFLKLSND